MAALIDRAIKGYNYLFVEIVDPRAASLPLVAKPYQCLAILGLYLMFVLKWGPRWMKNRPAFNLDRLMMLYNGIQVLACSYVCVYGFIIAWGWGGCYKWVCEPIDYSDNKTALSILKLVYFYYLLKVIDLLDTVFFVLRKRFNQISFLHVYHHAGMVLLIWGACTYVPGGHGTFVGQINTFVHAIMYSYYLITIPFPVFKKSFVKKCVTQLQILQFFLFVVHMSALVFMPTCEYPRWTAAVFLPQNLFMLILFVDFYIKTYIRKPENKKDGADKTNTGAISNQQNGKCEANGKIEDLIVIRRNVDGEKYK